MADLKEMLSKIGEMSPEDLSKAFAELPEDVQKKVVAALAGAGGGDEVKAVVDALPEEAKEMVRAASKSKDEPKKEEPEPAKEEEKPAEPAKEA